MKWLPQTVEEIVQLKLTSVMRLLVNCYAHGVPVSQAEHRLVFRAGLDFVRLPKGKDNRRDELVRIYYDLDAVDEALCPRLVRESLKGKFMSEEVLAHMDRLEEEKANASRHDGSAGSPRGLAAAGGGAGACGGGAPPG